MLAAGNTNNDFTIDANNGQITTVNQLDYETTVSYSLTVQAVDRSGDAQSMSATADVAITVTPVNEHDPVPTPAIVAKSIPESTAIGTVVHS